MIEYERGEREKERVVAVNVSKVVRRQNISNMISVYDATILPGSIVLKEDEKFL